MILNLNKNSVVVFDLDDTLFSEIDFLKSGFRHIVNKFCSESTNKVYKQLMSWYTVKKDPFENLIESYDLRNYGINKSQLINEYRYHIPKIKLRKGAIELLTQLKQQGIKTGIITDGRSLTQRNKLIALGIDNLFEQIIISEEIGSEKPALVNFSIFEHKFPKGNFYYFGDNTKKDFVTPNSLGWETICYLDPGTNIHKQIFQIENKYLPKYTIKNFAQILINFDEN
jgi:putative hydrolase of the HAD superfamily